MMWMRFKELLIILLCDRGRGDKDIEAREDSRELIGCLYFEDYSYSYSYMKGRFLTVLDNTSIQNKLVQYLRGSLFIFVVLKGFIFLFRVFLQGGLLSQLR